MVERARSSTEQYGTVWRQAGKHRHLGEGEGKGEGGTDGEWLRGTATPVAIVVKHGTTSRTSLIPHRIPS